MCAISNNHYWYDLTALEDKLKPEVIPALDWKIPALKNVLLTLCYV